MKVVLVAVPLINTRVPPLSIALLSGQLRKEGFDVKAFDFNIETYHNVSDELKEYWTFYKGFQWQDSSYFEEFIYPNIIGKNIDAWTRKILAEKPDIVGISVTNSPSGMALARKLKSVSPGIKIVIGGPGCTKAFDDPEKVPGELYDVVVHNEGELTLCDLLQQFAATGKLLPVPGCSTLDDDGNIVFQKLRPPMMDLDQLATPDFDDFNFSLYVDADNPRSDRREIPYYSSRGCPARCNFCMDYKMWDVQYRQKSPARIIEEMEFLAKKYNIFDFMFIELIFNGHILRMRELTRELKQRNNGFKFWGHGRIDPRMDLETMQLLKDAGFNWFIFGLESASNRVLKIMRKGYTVETADRVLENMLKVDLDCSVNIVVGFPGEGWNDYLDSIKFIYRHRKAIGHMPGLSSCYCLPGSDIYLYPEKFGIVVNAGQRPDCFNWMTTDGLNTSDEREYRKELMLTIFKQFHFKLKGSFAEPEFDIEKLDEFIEEYQKTKPRPKPFLFEKSLDRVESQAHQHQE